ncbi:MAG: 50S ribosomal protein L10 [Thermoflexales bacterium]
MAVTREKKTQMLANYAELIQKSQALFITHYGGLNMKDLDKVRSQIRNSQGEFHVTKNTLLRRALQEVGYDVPEAWLKGPTSVSFCFADPAAVAKALNELTRELEKLRVVGGVLAGKALNQEQVVALASLPSLETLRAQIIGMITAPASQLVGVLNAAIGGVVYALQAKVDKAQSAEPSAA